MVERGSTDYVQNPDAPRPIRNRLVRTCEVDDGTEGKWCLMQDAVMTRRGLVLLGPQLARSGGRHCPGSFPECTDQRDSTVVFTAQHADPCPKSCVGILIDDERGPTPPLGRYLVATALSTIHRDEPQRGECMDM